MYERRENPRLQYNTINWLRISPEIIYQERKISFFIQQI